MSEAVDRYTRLADQFGARVEAAADDAWSNPSPCEGWTARDVVAHVVNGQRRIAAGLTGGEPSEMRPDEDPKDAYRSSYSALKAALQDESKLQETFESPLGPMPVEAFLGRILATDVLVHTWDLARAVGGDERLDEEAVAGAYSGLKPMDAMIRQPGVFGPKVEPPGGADLQTEFLCFLGRRV